MSKAHLAVVNDTPSVLDFASVEQSIASRQPFASSREHAFQRYVLESVFNLQPEDVDQHITDGSQDLGVDIIYIDHSEKNINICSTKTVVDFKKSSRNFPGREIDKLKTFIDCVLARNEVLLKNCSKLIADKLLEIWDVLESDTYQLQVHLFSNQLPLAEAERNRLTAALSQWRIPLHEHHLYQLVHGHALAFTPKFKKKLRALRDQSFENLDAELNGITARISLPELYKFVNEGSSGSFDQHLVADNVRYFLGGKNPVNRQIRQTLESKQATAFWAMNNGITIVCEKCVSTAGSNFPLTLQNPQIVNGGQTAAIVHAVGSSDLELLAGASINVKIIQTTDRKLIKQIAIGSNTQTRVFGRDLWANDEMQAELARTLAAKGLFYRRKRGEVSPDPKAPILDSMRVGQILLAYVHGDPTRAKTSSNNIFGDLYFHVFDAAKIDANLVAVAWKVHEILNERKSNAIAHQRTISRNSYTETWIIEGLFHVIFIVGELLRKREKKLSSERDAVEVIDEAFSIVDNFVQSKKGVPAYRLFRLAATREKLLGEVRTLDGPLQSEFQF